MLLEEQWGVLFLWPQGQSDEIPYPSRAEAEADVAEDPDWRKLIVRYRRRLLEYPPPGPWTPVAGPEREDVDGALEYDAAIARAALEAYADLAEAHERDAACDPGKPPTTAMRKLAADHRRVRAARDQLAAECARLRAQLADPATADHPEGT